MLPPAPDDFWQRVVTEMARLIWQRETSGRVVAIATVAGLSTPVTSYAHNTAKPWHAQTPADADADPA